MYCHQCGKEVNDGVKFCPYCGTQLERPGFQQQQASQQPGGYQPINQQPSYYPREDDAPNPGFAILSFFIPIVGLILFVVWNRDYPLKAKSCLKGMVVGIVLYVVSLCCLFATIGSIASDEYDDWYNGYNTVVETVPYDTIH